MPVRYILFILIIILSTLHAEGVKRKKIIINGFLKPLEAKKFEKKFAATYYIKTVCHNYELELSQEKINDRYFIILKPFRNETLLMAVVENIRKSYPHAYIKKYFDKSPNLPNYVLGPMPEKKSRDVQIATVPEVTQSSSVPAPLKTKLHKDERTPKSSSSKAQSSSSNSSMTLLSKEEAAKYLRKKSPVSEDSFFVWGMVVAVTVVVSVGIFFIFRKRDTPETGETGDISEYLVSETQKNDSDEVSEPMMLKVDIHSHLIPGIDDGSKTMEESIALIVKLKTLGYTKLITTPHIMSHRYPNTSETILQGLEALHKELGKKEIDIVIEAASEYYLDEHFLDLLKAKDLLTFGGNFLLFEMSYVNHPLNLFEIVDAIKEAGYKPVLAHPERYLYMGKDFDKYMRLKDMGVYFQLNLNSLAGYYSPEVEEVAYKLIEKGVIDFLGSDTHKMRQALALETVLDSMVMPDIFKKNTILNNLL